MVASSGLTPMPAPAASLASITDGADTGLARVDFTRGRRECRKDPRPAIFAGVPAGAAGAAADILAWEGPTAGTEDEADKCACFWSKMTRIFSVCSSRRWAMPG